MNFKNGCNIFLIILIWWGTWELLGKTSNYIVKKKMLTYSQIYLIAILIGISCINFYKLDI